MNSFQAVRVCLKQLQFFAFAILAINIFSNLSLIMRYQTVCSLYDCLCTTVVALKFKHSCPCILSFKTQYVINIGTSKAIDALCVITNNTNALMFSGKLVDDTLLNIVGVLILVHQNIFKTFGIH